MAKLERFRGHFYNWYDTQDLRALEPKYISSVDSGNLGGHLIVPESACREIAAGAAFNTRWFKGAKDTLDLIAETLRENTETKAAPKLSSALDEFSELLAHRPTDVFAMARVMDEWQRCAHAIADIAGEPATGAIAELTIWANALRELVGRHRQDFRDAYAVGDISRAQSEHTYRQS